MKSCLCSCALLVATLILTAAVFIGNVFGRVNTKIDRMAGMRQGREVSVYRNPQTQETTGGERPLESFSTLSRYWAEHSGSRRVCLIGNSQMQSINLAPDEEGDGGSDPEKTYPELVADYFHQFRRDDHLVYRLSAGGLTYAEALWYLEYLSQTPAVKPDIVFLQVNYQAFWTNGVRDGMLEMLNDPGFRSTVERVSKGPELVSDVFADALSRFDEQRARDGAAASAPWTVLPAARPASRGLGNALETRVRALLGHLPGFDRRGDQREALLTLLYRARVVLLNVRPSTPRSIDGARFARSQACLRAIATLCRERGIRLALFNAPLNPRISLYRVDEDRRRYEHFVKTLAADYQIPLYDYQASIPAEGWGMLFNGPDPLHMGRGGHRLLARVFIHQITALQAN